mmetsp:Transcript_7717/g.25581  ORF Transcript_7717/g.25581 Transcript_7717/m.25581 type:complete len:476 (-) Transcript_7717:15-1442(-)
MHVPNRDAVAPPQLARDAPVLDVFEPVVPRPFEARRHNLHLARLHRLERGLRERLHLDEPLLRNERLNHLAAALAAGHLHLLRLLLYGEPSLLEVRPNRFAALCAVHLGVLSRLAVHRPVLVHDVDHRQVLPLPDGVVVRVVPGCHLERARPKLTLDVVIRDDRDAPPAAHRHLALAPDQMGEPVILGVHTHRRIPEDGFRTRRRHWNALLALFGIRERVVEIVKRPHLIGVLHLQVRHRRLQLGRPVDHVRASVDEPAVVERHESLRDGVAQLIVEGEALAAPVARRAEPSDLHANARAVLRLPLPHPLEKRLTPEVCALHPFRVEHLFHNELRRNAGVVRPWEPQRRAPAHALVARHDVLKRHKHRVTHVQRPSHVRRRHRDCEGLARRRLVRLEVTRRLPPRVQALLRLVVLKVLWQLGRLFPDMSFTQLLAHDSGRAEGGVRAHGRRSPPQLSPRPRESAPREPARRCRGA